MFGMQRQVRGSYEVGSSRAAHGRSDRNNIRGGGRLLPYGANSFVRSIDDHSKFCAVLRLERMRDVVVNTSSMMAHLAGRYANGGRLLLAGMACCAYEQQQQVDSDGGQAAS